MAYAKGTEVPVDRSRAEIEHLLKRYGADQFASGWELNRAIIGFRCNERFVRFVLTLPSQTDKAFTHALRRGASWARPRPKAAAAAAYDAELRRLWRALALVIKAKLEAVESGIATFENEFMAHIVLPGGKTVGEQVRPQIEQAYKSGKAMPLLLGAGGSE